MKLSSKLLIVAGGTSLAIVVLVLSILNFA